MKNRTFIIAEAGVNHNNDPAIAHQLIDVAKASGADAVKFQSFRAEALVTRTAAKAEYQKAGTAAGSQFEMLKQLELSVELQDQLVRYCATLGIEFMSTAFDEESAELLVEQGIRRIKIPSGEVTNLPFIRKLASYKLPIILSTGMCDLAEVAEAIAVIGPDIPITLLHCTSNYPTAYTDVNLRAMQTLAREFNYPVGYSDHTLGTLVPALAVSMGATVIEKHFTIDRSLPGPDHQASLTPDELTEMVAHIRLAEDCLGDGIKQPRATELAVRDVARRSVTLVNSKSAGEMIAECDLQILRPGTGISPKFFESVIGTRAKQSINAGTTLTWEMLEK